MSNVLNNLQTETSFVFCTNSRIHEHNPLPLPKLKFAMVSAENKQFTSETEFIALQKFTDPSSHHFVEEQRSQ